MKTTSLVAAVLLAVGTDAVVADVAPRAKALAYSPPHYPSPWADPEAEGWQEAYAKAKKFVSTLSLIEKVNLTTGVGWLGERCVGNVGEIASKGMRGLCLQDGPLGLRLADYNTAFPGGITAGASWSKKLWEQRGLFLGREAKEKGVDVLLGPVAGPIGRAPEGGRNWEGFSVDPYVAGKAFALTSVGVQKAGTIACGKHWVGNEQEHFRQGPEAAQYGFEIDESLSTNIDDKTLHELYAWPFADAVKAGLGSVMCSYQQINNSYGCQNSKLINGVLKEELGFQGFVVSDWQAQHAGAATAAAGLDMTMPGDTSFNTGVSYWGANLTLAVINGTVAQWRVDDMAVRIMSAFFKVGKSPDTLIDINFSSWSRDTIGPIHPAANDGIEQINFQVDVRHDHHKHVRESAAKGTVVLKNNGILPLHKPKFVAVIGEDAGPNPAGPNGCDNRGCNNGTLAMAWGSGTSEFTYLVTPDQALQEQALKDHTRYESVLANNYWTQTKALISQPNVTAIVFANANAGEGFINVDNNIGDRKNLTLWKQGDELIKNVSSINPRTIVVLHTVGPVLVTDWYKNPNISAIVWAGLPGQESGNSLTDILYGKTSPGRTPFTWGKTRKSYGTDLLYKPNRGKDAPQQDFSEGVFVDYRHFDRLSPSTDRTKGSKDAPIFEFGYGLSWSTFKYSNLQVKSHSKTQNPYQRPPGKTIAAPVLGTHSKDLKDYVFPSNIRYIYQHIYPYLNTSSSGKAASADPQYGKTAKQFLPPKALDGSPQPKNPAGGAPGGNPALWDVLYTVTATITNTGKRTTDEIPQLYVSHGGKEPIRVLRGFERLENIAPGQSVTFKADLTRRDLSNWDPAKQNWVITDFKKKIYVGSSSRELPLSATLK